MTITNRTSVSDLAKRRRARMASAAGSAGAHHRSGDRLDPQRLMPNRAEAERLATGAVEADPPITDRADAERLVSDLAALIDAGLVVVRRQLGGPARYGAVGGAGGVGGVGGAAGAGGAGGDAG